MKLKIFILLLLVLAKTVTAQNTEKVLDKFEEHYKSAITYSELSLFGECIHELGIAIEFARKNNLKEQAINATITLAETMRKTGDFAKGMELLQDITGSLSYPKLHVRKLGRIAAIYNQWLPDNTLNQKKLVKHYLDSALSMATALNLKEEQAGLYNEMGYILFAKNYEEGLGYLKKSAQLFQQLNDTHNYVSAMTNVLRAYLSSHDSVEAYKVIENLLPLVEGRKWYTAEMELYSLVATYYKVFSQDYLAVMHWNSMLDKSIIKNLSAVNSSQMNAFRTLYETKKLQDQFTAMELVAKLRQEALEKETKRSRELIIYLSILILLVVGVIALLFRERGLKQRLKTTNDNLSVSNEKYQLLMVESNHRIKNNLQMVISMLQYSENQLSAEVTEAFKQMSTKIQTISALHKHLSADVHNELIPLDVYFNEIIAYYKNITSVQLPIIKAVVPVKIKSERIVYFGLILNEMLLNTLEHGNAARNKIKINVLKTTEGYLFNYIDHSPHLTDTKKGTGTILIKQLIERVGGSGFMFDPTNGSYQFKFYE